MANEAQQAADNADAAKNNLSGAAREYASNPTPQNEQNFGDAYQSSAEAHSEARPLHGGSGA
ncbi:hypothetical protein E1281_39195 [Actinomadura sp. KC345]|uniref:hypothetical protein n=1 Tax=Actinomadura sp. KC345 TaxID=2530371 RepID=UPI0010442557|nr:hypothetical protein [Actinomadura sp. KC345]TDC38339.1 hypothetical protein E1281_39195 [Actinomadura sp. KC345]